MAINFELAPLERYVVYKLDEKGNPIPISGPQDTLEIGQLKLLELAKIIGFKGLSVPFILVKEVTTFVPVVAKVFSLSTVTEEFNEPINGAQAHDPTV